MRPFLLVLAITASSTFVAADPDPKAEAQQHIDKATTLFAANKPAEALVELQAAIALDPRPELLYAIGQAHASLGQCDQAATYFGRYLATHPEARSADLARQAIAACKDASPPPKPEPQPEVTRPPDEVTAQPESPTLGVEGHARSPWYRDALGDALVGSGTIAGVVAALLYRDATKKIDAANRATTYPERDKLSSDAHSRRTYSIVIGAGAAVLVGTGIVRYVLRPHGDVGGLGIAPAPGGGGVVTWSGRL